VQEEPGKGGNVAEERKRKDNKTKKISSLGVEKNEGAPVYIGKGGGENAKQGRGKNGQNRVLQISSIGEGRGNAS